jgi:oligoribonuclease NrnB/cAMP/cGMP phosphodiesterase (DHH superfamily)
MKYILYHGNCYDGFGAAYAAWKALGDTAKYIPVSYGNPLPEMPDAEVVYILDFSYSKEILLELAKKTSVIVLDHHKTAQENLAELVSLKENQLCPNDANPFVIFDMDHSGAYLAWDFFHPSKPVPKLIMHLEDRDLWRFKLEGSKEIHSALVSLPFDFKVWDTLDADSLIAEGAACLRFESSVVDKIVSKSWVGEIDNHKVPMVNTAAHWSEVGHALLDKYPEAPFAACFTVFNDSVMWSLRSRIDFDVSEVAKKFGGGGHRQAAGFKSARF